MMMMTRLLLAISGFALIGFWIVMLFIAFDRFHHKKPPPLY